MLLLGSGLLFVSGSPSAVADCTSDSNTIVVLENHWEECNDGTCNDTSSWLGVGAGQAWVGVTWSQTNCPGAGQVVGACVGAQVNNNRVCPPI